LEKHWIDAQKNLSACQECHGDNLLGGIATVSCFSATKGAQNCHAGGPVGPNAGHGEGWKFQSRHGRQGAMATPAQFSAGFAYCSKCHGSEFKGGIGKATSCYSCHTKAPHPDKPWHGTTASGTNHVFADPNNAGQCYLCHKDGNNSGLKPSSPAIFGSPPSCFNNTLCHNNSGHSAKWTDPTSNQFHKYTASISSSCTLCHGVNYDGVGGTAPSCANTNSKTGLKCHSDGKPINQKASDCSSCHGVPPNAAAFPNAQKSHSAHNGLQDVSCSSCHKGGGTGTSNHANGTPFMSISTGFRAKTGTANPVYTSSSGTCANTSCHGGKVTPNWGGATPECTNCHEQGTERYTPEYNSYYSGYRNGKNLHAVHINTTQQAITCISCHDDSKLTNQQHFSGLASHTFSSPGNTVSGGLTNIGSYDISKKECSGVTCHPSVTPIPLPRDNNQWIGN
jgi:predicted CxxxxCH...CXXCH cytochrome family protein